MTERRETRIVLFDIGGVLVKTSGVATLLDWLNNRMTAEELWTTWLTSPCVRAFETGRISADAFAEEIIRALSLPIDSNLFLAEMATSSVDRLPGAIELIQGIPPRFFKATLCNSNAVHWPRLMQNRQLACAFDRHFASHLMGKIKPDLEAFQLVIAALGCEPQDIFFLDDNQLNVDGARAAGIHSARIQGVAAAEKALFAFGVLGS